MAQRAAPRRPWRWAYAAVAFFAAVGLIAFFVLPFLDVIVIAWTGVQLATSLGASDLWITVGAQGAALLISLLVLASPSMKHGVRLTCGTLAGVLAIGAALPLYAFYGKLASYVPSAGATTASIVATTLFIGAGFWLCVISSIGIFIGCVVALITEQ
jgi:hypothetical protein